MIVEILLLLLVKGQGRSGQGGQFSKRTGDTLALLPRGLEGGGQVREFPLNLVQESLTPVASSPIRQAPHLHGEYCHLASRFPVIDLSLLE